VSYKKQELLTLRELLSSPRVFGGVRVTHLFVFLCCPIICVSLRSELRFPPINVFTSSCLWEDSCLIYVVCVCLCIVVPNTYCVVFLFCFFSSCVPYVFSFSGLSIFFISLRYSLTFIWYILLTAVKINKILLVHCNNKFYCKNMSLFK
jgi:hypothetical protein